ncbi:hypothetical protein ABZU86_22275 [Streptomyces sp. NPDC005271]|uniref:hypothetical protein n=1 Tax=unclassified Streptomyces TaxID=2593676 RepID=UPI0033A9F54D
MSRLPRPGTLAVLHIQATVLLAALGLLVSGTLLTAGGLTTLTVKPVRTVTPDPTDSDSESPLSPTPPTTPPPTTPTQPPTSPPTSAPQPTPSPSGMFGPGLRAAEPPRVEENSAALLTAWLGFIGQVLGLMTGLIGIFTGTRRREAAASGQDERPARPARVRPTDQPPRGRRPRRR